MHFKLKLPPLYTSKKVGKSGVFKNGKGERGMDERFEGGQRRKKGEERGV